MFSPVPVLPRPGGHAFEVCEQAYKVFFRRASASAHPMKSPKRSCTASASFMTGEVLRVNGGRTAS